jgi:shikimate kinase
MKHDRPTRRGLALVGYRGTGKTTVGRLLAERIGWAFADADHEIEALAGRPVAEIFADEGETAFRDYEERVIADLATRPETVVATGGGAVLRESNRAALRSVGFVAWLTADPETIARRISSRLSTRPALTPAGALGEISDVLAARTAHYRAVSDLEVETAHRTCREVADAVLRAWQGGGAGGASR